MNGKQIVILIVIVIILMTISEFISYNNELELLRVTINRLDKDISISESRLLEIKQELKDNIAEYKDYEAESNKIAVENIDPQIVLSIYPDLKSSTMYNKFNSQYLKLTRDIQDNKTRYNDSVEEYNRKLVTLRGRILGRGRQLKEYKE